MKKVAVILFNLGGPNNLQAVKPFLFNLFNDNAIIALPQPLRFIFATIISTLRNKKACNIYSKMGGKSTLLKETLVQASALNNLLNNVLDDDTFNKDLESNKTCYQKKFYTIFLAMSYWYPFIHETVQKVKDLEFDEIILLPLYPHFSTTTSMSSIDRWMIEAKKCHLTCANVKVIQHYYNHPLFISAHFDLLYAKYNKAIELVKHERYSDNALSNISYSTTTIHSTSVTNNANTVADDVKTIHNSNILSKIRVLFSAHSIPLKCITKGDPYKSHVEESVRLIIASMHSIYGINNVDYKLCYQSKVGKFIKWLEPSIKDELVNAKKDDKLAVIIVPISFVSEHSETLVELDVDYKEFAISIGILIYLRVATLGINKNFIECLKDLCMN